jgi:Spy/CpxP family protein refolding chaperone
MRRILAGLAVVALVIGAFAGATAALADEDDDWIAQEVDELVAQAPPPPPGPAPAGPPGPPPDPMTRLRRALSLNDDQVRRIQQIFVTFRTRTEKIRIDLGRARLDAREAMLEAAPDRGRLEGIARRMGDLQGQLIRARFEMMLEIKPVLTPDQWARLRLFRPLGGMPRPPRR